MDQAQRIEAKEASEILAIFGLSKEDLEAVSTPVVVLCAWCEPALASVSHGCCVEHAAMIRNS